MHHVKDIFVYFTIDNVGIVLGSQLETFSTGNTFYMSHDAYYICRVVVDETRI